MWPVCRCQLCLAVGPGIWARTEQAISSASESDEQNLADRRDLYKGEGQRPVSLSYRRLHRSNDRFSSHGQTDTESARRFFRKAVSAEGNPTARILNVDKKSSIPGSSSRIESRTYAVRSCSAAGMPLLKQWGGARSSLCEKTYVAIQRIRLVSERVADVAGH